MKRTRGFSALAAFASMAVSLSVWLPEAAGAIGSNNGVIAPLHQVKGAKTIKDHYIVALKGKPNTAQGMASAKALDRAKSKGIKVDARFDHVLNGYAASLTADELTAVRRDPDVEYVEPDAVMYGGGGAESGDAAPPSASGKERTRTTAGQSTAAELFTVDNPAKSRGLDRIDQPALPLDYKYHYEDGVGGPNVTIFIVNHGIRSTHQELTGLVDEGYSNVPDAGTPNTDCNGRGTSVAAAAAGHSLGVAKGATPGVRLRAVRVTSCPTNQSTVARFLDGLNWIQGRVNQGVRPAIAVINMWDPATISNDAAAVNSAVNGLRENGIVPVIAAPYSTTLTEQQHYSCGYIPANLDLPLTVGVTDLRPDLDGVVRHDRRVGPWGSCVNIHAPGVDIKEASDASDTATNFGTNPWSSYGSALGYVAGVAALQIKRNPTATVAQVEQAILSEAKHVVEGTSGSDNLLLHWPHGGGADEPPAEGEDEEEVDGYVEVESIARSVSADFNGDGRTDKGSFGDPARGGCSDTSPMFNSQLWMAYSQGEGSLRIQRTGPSSFSRPLHCYREIKTGDFNGDGRDDVVAFGKPGSPAGGYDYGSFSIGLSNPDGTFTERVIDRDKVGGECIPSGGLCHATAGGKFLQSVNQSNRLIVPGDYNQDRRTDLMMLAENGGAYGYLLTNNGDGTFSNRHVVLDDFVDWAMDPFNPEPVSPVNKRNVSGVAGDVDGDGRDDIVLAGGVGWNTQPVAFSHADGSWTVTNKPAKTWATWAAQPVSLGRKTQVAVGDVNRDGKDDILLAGGGSTWGSIPVAVSHGDGTFDTVASLMPNQQFAAKSQEASVDFLGGDFDGDGRFDAALSGGPDWHTFPVAFSLGNATFSVSNDCYCRGVTPAPTSVASAWNTDGTLQVVGVTRDEKVMGRRGSTDASGSTTWTPWAELPGAGMRTVTMEANANGRLELFGVDVLGKVFHRQQTAVNADTWTDWTPMDGWVNSLAAARGGDGRITLFGVSDAGVLYSRKQVGPDSGSWTNWVATAGLGVDGQGLTRPVRSVAAERHGDGRVFVFAITDGDHPYYTFDGGTGPGGFGGWWAMGGSLTSISVARQQNGKLFLTGTTRDETIFQSYQTGTGTTGFSPWNQQPGSLRSVAVEINPDLSQPSGRSFNVLGVNALGFVFHRVGDTWTPFAQIDGILKP